MTRQRDEPTRAGELRCPACGDLVVPGRLPSGDWTYATCPRCASAWLDPLPPGDPTDLYGEGYFQGTAVRASGGQETEGGYGDYEADEALHRRNAVERLARVSQRLGPSADGRRILDVGCAHGYLLDQAVATGWEAVGVEVSPYARAEAQERGHQVVASLEALPHHADFDVVCFFQVLEHLPDPAHALSAAASRLRHGGLLVVETWDRTSRTARAFRGGWQQINPPTVIHLFSKAGLRRLLLRDAFTGVDVRRTSKLVSLGLATSVVVHRLGPLEGVARKVIDRPSIAGRAVRYPLDDLVTATAIRS
jgi:SAM-dependent methyltransferase